MSDIERLALVAVFFALIGLIIWLDRQDGKQP